jgi:hypothetical protein
MQRLYRLRTPIGPFFITDRGERWHVVFDNESLGSYTTPMQAAYDVASGRIFSLPHGADTSMLGVPEDIAKWERVPI